MSAGPNDKLRVVSVGCGERGVEHLKAMAASGAMDLVAACDLDEARLRAAGERFHIPRLYRDLEEMIRKEKPELVDIVTPPTIRVGIVEAALRAEAPAVLIEKPLALWPSEVRRLRDLGRDRLIAVNLQCAWMPHWQGFWDLLRDRALGPIYSLRASTAANILEEGPHTLDLALRAARLAGLPTPEWVLAAVWGVEHFGPTPVPHDVSAVVGLGPARLYLNHGPSAPPV